MIRQLDRSQRVTESAEHRAETGSSSAKQSLHFAGTIERALRTVLIADVVESVRLIEKDEEGVIKRWLALVRHVETDLIAGSDGRLVNFLGDGFMLEFADARTAVSTALAIQHASKRQNFGQPPEQQMLLRIGIEISDVIVESREVYGHGVNLAARLTDLAGPGEIVISARVYDQITASLDADIEDLGDCFLKHVQDPVRAYRVGPPGPHPKIESGFTLDRLLPTLAIIPFTSRCTAPEHEVLGEILAEELIREASYSPDMNVISRLSTTAFRGRNVTLAEISLHLNADYVLSGLYRVDDQRVRLDVELAEARSAHVVWVRSFTDRVAGMLGGEQELISCIVADVRAAILSREVQHCRSQPLPTLENYTLLIAAIALMNGTSLQGFEEANKLLQTLIDRATRQPIAQAWLANWHVLRVQQGWSPDPELDARLALNCTTRALDADPECSLALAIDGFVHTNLLKRLDVALERYKLALEANPSNALAWLLKGTLHAFMADGRQAMDNTLHALELSPLDPQSYFYDSLAATACNAAHQYRRGIRLAQRSLRANRGHTSTLRTLAVAQWKLGLHEEARRTGQELLALEPNFTVSDWLKRSPSASFSTGQQWMNVFRKIGLPE